MQTIELTATSRDAFGKKGAKSVRREGSIPCVIYGNGENVHCSLDYSVTRAIIDTPNSYIINLLIGDKTESVVLREVQFHPVNDTVRHIDFYRVDAKKPIMIEVPIKLEGVAEGVKMGGKLSLAKRRVSVLALTKDLPDFLTVDVTPLELGKSIFVSDLKFENLTIVTPATTAICAVKMTRAARGAAAAAANTKK